MFYDFSTDVKEEPEWVDYCISEAQARAVRGVKAGPALAPLTNPIASTDANTETASIRESTSKNDTEKERNSQSHYVKEESETEVLQECAGLYEYGNEEHLRLRVDFCSGASVKVEINTEREEGNETAASQKPKVVNSRRDLTAINDVAQEVNRKRILQPDKGPVIIKKYTNNVKHRVIPKTNSHQKTHYLGISPRKEDINETKTATANENNLQEVTNICKIVIINPEADQARQSQLKTHQLSNSENPNKNESLSINSIAHTETGRSLGSATLQSKGGTKTILPQPTPQLPIGILRPMRAPIQQKLPKQIFQHINVPISRLGNNVYLKPLNPANIVTIPSSQSETVNSQPPNPAFKVFKPVTVLETQSAMPKLLSAVSGIHNLQPIPKLLNGTESTLQSAAIPKPQSKHLTRPISKSSAEVISQPNILNGKLIPIMSSITNNPSVKCNLEGVPDGEKKIAVACVTKSNTSATPVKVNSSAVSIHFQKIAPKPISKSVIFPTPEPNDNHLYHRIEHNNGQLEVQNQPNMEVTTPSIQVAGPNIQQASHNIQRIFPKPISKLTANSQLQKPNGNNLIHKIGHKNRQLEVQNKPNIQVTTPNIQVTAPNIPQTAPNIQPTSHNIQRIFPKPISQLTANSQLQKPNGNDLIHKIGHKNGQLEVQNKPNIQVTAPNIPQTAPNIQPTSHNMQRIFPKPISKLTATSQLLKENGNNLLHKVDVENNNRMPEKCRSNAQLTTPNVQRMAPKPTLKLITNSQIPKPNDNNLYDEIENNNEQSKEDNNTSNIQFVPKSQLIDDNTISRNIIQDYQPKVAQNIPSIRQITPTPKPPHKPGNSIPKTVDNNQPRINDCQREPNQTDPSYIQPLLLEYLHTTNPPPLITEPFEKPIHSVDKSNINSPSLVPFEKPIHSVAKSNNPPSLVSFEKPIHSVAKSNINPPSIIPLEKPIHSAKSNINPPSLIPFEKPIHSVAKSNINPPTLIPFEKPIHSVAKSNINPIPQKSYGRPELKSNLPLNCNTQPPHNVPILEDPAQPSNEHDDQLDPNLNLQPNEKTEASKKVPKLEDFLTPSYVKLDHLRKRTCKVCQKVYYDRKAYLDHTITHFENKRDSVQTDTKHIKRITCYCQKRFNTFKGLIRHVGRSHVPKRYCCDYCSKGFTDKRSMMNHIRTHTGERPYKCSICKKRYRTYTNLMSHKAVHSQRDQKHCCPICDRPFHTVTARNRHLQIHSGLRPHVCEICKQTFAVKYHLQRHMDSHIGERRFSCEYCKKRFLRKSHLSRHVNTVHVRKLKKEGRKLKRKGRKRQKVLPTTETHEMMESQANACEVANDT